MLCYVYIGGYEFSRPVESWMRFRWPSRKR
jgi:hypothetical protein